MYGGMYVFRNKTNLQESWGKSTKREKMVLFVRSFLLLSIRKNWETGTDSSNQPVSPPHLFKPRVQRAETCCCPALRSVRQLKEGNSLLGKNLANEGPNLAAFSSSPYKYKVGMFMQVVLSASTRHRSFGRRKSWRGETLGARHLGKFAVVCRASGPGALFSRLFSRR